MGVLITVLLYAAAAALLLRRWAARPHPAQSSLKWSFAGYMLACIAVAFLLCFAVTACFEMARNDLYEKYEAVYKQDYFVQAYLVDAEGNLISSQLVGLTEPDGSTHSIQDYMAPQEKLLYTLCQVYPFLLPLVCAGCIGTTSVLFYRRRLKLPLETLDGAAQRITAGDLDFSVQLLGHDELARLGASFETMRAALAQTNRALWRTLEDERRMQAAFAHDLRTPLTILRGYDEFLLKYADALPPEKLRATLETMHGSLQRLEDYTTRMGRVRKLEELALQPAPVQLGALCEALRADGAALCGGLAFTLDGCEGVFPLDEAALREVYENLVNNAARHAAARVQAMLRCDGAQLSLLVADDGPGFSEAALAHAADAFWRDDGGARDARHFGLGLYLCRVLCEKHGGGLAIANGPGGGGQVTALFRPLDAPGGAPQELQPYIDKKFNFPCYTPPITKKEGVFMNQQDHAIVVRQLTQRYGRKAALQGLDLTIPQGMFGLLGRNGAGKTTLMRTIATLMRCQSGSVTVCGIPVEQAAAVRAKIGYLPQDFAMYPNLSVRQALRYLGTLSGMDSALLDRRVPQVLRQVNLAAQAGKRVRELSGGMLRRLGVAQALLHDPEVLIVDEPTAGLDPEERVRLRELLGTLAQEKTVVFSTHIASDIEAACGQIAILDGGQLRYRGTVQQLCRATGAANLEQAYLACVHSERRLDP